MSGRKLVIRILTFIGGLFFLLEFMIPATQENDENFLTPYLPNVMSFVVVVGTMALLLGPINLVRSHWKKIYRRMKGWGDSVVFLVFLVVGIISAYLFNNLSYYHEHYTVAPWFEQTIRSSYNASYYGIQLAFGASSMGLLSFYLISAAYRSFRLNNLESSVMMASAVIVLLGLVPLGNWMTGGLPTAFQLSTWTAWLLGVPNTAVQRAVMIGAVGGAFAAGLRHWLGLGRTME